MVFAKMTLEMEEEKLQGAAFRVSTRDKQMLLIYSNLGVYGLSYSTEN